MNRTLPSLLVALAATSPLALSAIGGGDPAADDLLAPPSRAKAQAAAERADLDAQFASLEASLAERAESVDHIVVELSTLADDDELEELRRRVEDLEALRIALEARLAAQTMRADEIEQLRIAQEANRRNVELEQRALDPRDRVRDFDARGARSLPARAKLLLELEGEHGAAADEYREVHGRYVESLPPGAGERLDFTRERRELMRGRRDFTQEHGDLLEGHGPGGAIRIFIEGLPPGRKNIDLEIEDLEGQHDVFFHGDHPGGGPGYSWHSSDQEEPGSHVFWFSDDFEGPHGFEADGPEFEFEFEDHWTDDFEAEFLFEGNYDCETDCDCEEDREHAAIAPALGTFWAALDTPNDDAPERAVRTWVDRTRTEAPRAESIASTLIRRGRPDAGADDAVFFPIRSRSDAPAPRAVQFGAAGGDEAVLLELRELVHEIRADVRELRDSVQELRAEVRGR